MEWCKYILCPFRTRFADHIFPSGNFWVSLSSDKVEEKVWSMPLEPGLGRSGSSRGMGGIPSLPGLLLLAQTFLPSSLGAVQGSVCTTMCTAPVSSARAFAHARTWVLLISAKYSRKGSVHLTKCQFLQHSDTQSKCLLVWLSIFNQPKPSKSQKHVNVRISPNGLLF